MLYNLITILGPTATGKTKLSAQLAYHFNGEIISADSRQAYKRMNIGTGKDLNDYEINNIKINYYLIDIIEPSEEFNLFLFKKNFNEAFQKIKDKKKLPFLVGGTGLYLSSILQNYKLKEASFNKAEYENLNNLPEKELKEMLMNSNLALHNTTDLINKDRIIKAILIDKSEGEEIRNVEEINSLNIGVIPARTEIKNRIKERLKKRFDEGMVEEVEELIKSGITFDKLSFFGLEYKFIALYLEGKLNYNDLFQKLNSAINDFAKRQITWFRKMQKEGIKINWIENADYNKAKQIIEKHLS